MARELNSVIFMVDFFFFFFFTTNPEVRVGVAGLRLDVTGHAHVCAHTHTCPAGRAVQTTRRLYLACTVYVVCAGRDLSRTGARRVHVPRP